MKMNFKIAPGIFPTKLNAFIVGGSELPPSIGIGVPMKVIQSIPIRYAANSPSGWFKKN